MLLWLVALLACDLWLFTLYRNLVIQSRLLNMNYRGTLVVNVIMILLINVVCIYAIVTS